MDKSPLDTVGKRARVVWRAFSAQALAALASMPLWYPVIEATARAALGDHAEPVIQTAIAVAGIFGWLKPQPGISGR